MDNLALTTQQRTKIKTFWQRPEGKFGAFMLIPITGLLIYGIGLAMPFIVSMLANTLTALLLILGIALLGYIGTNKKTWMAISVAYQVLMKKITGFIITIDPVGIVKNEIIKLQEKSNQFEKEISRIRGNINQLERIILENQEEIDNSLAIARQAKNKNLSDTMNLQTRKAGRRTKSNQNYTILLDKLKSIYERLSAYKKIADIMIEDKNDLVEQKTREFKTLKTAYGAFKSAMSIFNQTPDERAIFDQTMEFMADEVSNQIGEMDRFQEASKSFLESADLQNGVYQEEGLKLLENWETQSKVQLNVSNKIDSNWNNLLK